jgi:hypothetical protein
MYLGLFIAGLIASFIIVIVDSPKNETSPFNKEWWLHTYTEKVNGRTFKINNLQSFIIANIAFWVLILIFLSIV